MYQKYIKHPITHGENYRQLRNQVNNLIRQSKAKYYQNLLKSQVNDNKNTWKTLNHLMNRNSKASNQFKIKKEDGNFTEDSNDIAEIFNQYFLSAPRNIANNLPPPTKNFQDYLSGSFPELSNFRYVTPDDICKLIEELKTTGGSGYLEIPTKVLKCIMHAIATRLANIFNRCLSEGFFPESLKIAQVVPVYKAGDSFKPCNYRPISVLTCISKILEKIVYSQVSKHLDINNILNGHQYGFRKGVSTDIAIGKLMEKITHCRNNNEIGLCVFLDLQKAFDLVDTRILLNKLSHYGINGPPLRLIQSFLENRSQFVRINTSSSSTERVSLGTPQGSILSPMLFT